MNSETLSPEDRARQLRRAFDESFSRPPVEEATEAYERIISLRVGGQPYAAKLSEVAGLLQCGKLVPFPSPLPSLLGLTAVRGEFMAVHSLCRLLHHRPGNAVEARWLLLCGTHAPVALAFETFSGHRQLPRSAFSEKPVHDNEPCFQMVRIDSEIHPVLHLPTLVEAIYRAARRGRPDEEHS